MTDIRANVESVTVAAPSTLAQSAEHTPASRHAAWDPGHVPASAEPGSKRMFDLVLSGIGLIVSAPLWLLCAVVIRLGDGGPVFHIQERVGKGGRRFPGYKFRSMTPDSDEHHGPRQASPNDHRVTRVGRLLRATGMDELPQFINILKGDMSFVGPRALLPEEIEVDEDSTLVPIEAIPGYQVRHRVTPGLTGLAQIYARRDIPRRDKFRFDAIYVRRRSFFLDLKLFLLSFWISFRGKWEVRGGEVVR